MTEDSHLSLPKRIHTIWLRPYPGETMNITPEFFNGHRSVHIEPEQTPIKFTITKEEQINFYLDHLED